MASLVRRAAGSSADPAQVEVQVVKLMQRGLQRTRDHLQRACGARRAGHEQHELVGGHTRIGCQRQADIVGRKLRCLEQADGNIRSLPHADLVEEILAADRRADRTAGHREVAWRAHLPACILRGKACRQRLFAFHRHDRPGAAGPGEGKRLRQTSLLFDPHGTESGQRRPCEKHSCFHGSGSLHAAVHDAAAAGDRVAGDAERI